MTISNAPANWTINMRTIQFKIEDGLNILTGSFEAVATEKPSTYPSMTLEFAGRTFPIQVVSITAQQKENCWSLACDFEEAGREALLTKNISIGFVYLSAQEILDLLVEKEIATKNIDAFLGDAKMSFQFQGTIENLIQNFARILGVNVRWVR